MNKQVIYLNTVGVVCAAGLGKEALKAACQSDQSVMTVTNAYHSVRALPLGLYTGELPDIPLSDTRWHTRNNQLALAAYEQIRVKAESAINRYGAHRVGVIIGTSTSGIAEGEAAIRALEKQGQLPDDFHYSVQEMGATAQFLSEITGAKGPVYGISTACSSGSKALATARRLIRSGLCDAVIAGGVDSLCKLVVQGFSALEAVSETVCNPFSKNRDGINIGEGAALFLVSAESEGVQLLGVGESSDAHHISAPDPTGQGAIQCMQAALNDASMTAGQVDYLNLHGTATPLNDQMEARAVEQVLGLDMLCSSTKPVTGHTLGAAGAIEAAICYLLLTDETGFLPVQRWDEQHDPGLPMVNLVSKSSASVQASVVMSNSFAFGGNNICLLLAKA